MWYEKKDWPTSCEYPLVHSPAVPAADGLGRIPP
jgi:hypothetical protein